MAPPLDKLPVEETTRVLVGTLRSKDGLELDVFIRINDSVKGYPEWVGDELGNLLTTFIDELNADEDHDAAVAVVEHSQAASPGWGDDYYNPPPPVIDKVDLLREQLRRAGILL
jgi:hypothetical protein